MSTWYPVAGEVERSAGCSKTLAGMPVEKILIRRLLAPENQIIMDVLLECRCKYWRTLAEYHRAPLPPLIPCAFNEAAIMENVSPFARLSAIHFSNWGRWEGDTERTSEISSLAFKNLCRGAGLIGVAESASSC